MYIEIHIPPIINTKKTTYISIEKYHKINPNDKYITKCINIITNLRRY